MTWEWWTVAWALLFGMVLVVETITIFQPRRGDTLSEHVWVLRANRIGRLILLPLWCWLSYHFWLEPGSLREPVWWDDVTVVAVSFLIALRVRYAKRGGKPPELASTRGVNDE